MKEKYNGVEVPRDGAAIEYDAPASQGKTPPFAKGAPFPRQGKQDGAPEKASPARFLVITNIERANGKAENR